MQILFSKSWWEMMREPAEVFLDRCVADGFHSELYLPAVPADAATIRSWHEDRGLLLVAQMITEGATPDEHLATLEERFAFAVECGAQLVNSHTGRDIFPFADNVKIFERACELSSAAGVAFVNETHRGRPTYSAVETARYLQAVPAMRLNADVSHWMCVHESDLSDQPDNVALAVSRSDHIHARVGHSEGPQVSHPLAPEWASFLEAHLQIWDAIVERHRQEGAERLFITPEFGPRPYMPTLPYTYQPVADTWAVNVQMRDLLAERYGLD